MSNFGLIDTLLSSQEEEHQGHIMIFRGLNQMLSLSMQGLQVVSSRASSRTPPRVAKTVNNAIKRSSLILSFR